MNNERTYQVTIGILILVIIIGGWYAFMSKTGNGDMGTDASSTEMTSDSVATDTASTDSTSAASLPAETTKVARGESVTISDQSAGMSVALASLSLGEAGWVAVRDASGRILGAAWFPAGTRSNVTVPLLRTTVTGGHYQALLYADDGNKRFDLHKETLITNSDGSVAGTTFSVK